MDKQPSIREEPISEIEAEVERKENHDNQMPSRSSDASAVSQDMADHAEVKSECPNTECGVAIIKNKKGQFPKICPWCDIDLSSLFQGEVVCLQKSDKEDQTTDAAVTKATKIVRPKLVVEIQPLTVYSECGFCCLKLIEIEGPRVLPCGHIQCTQCIELNIDNTVISCKIKECRKEFTDISIEILPEISKEIISDVLVPISKRCDLCNGDPMMAVKCCADCKKKLCIGHATEHEQHISNHELLLLEDGLSPERYEVQRCDAHENHVLNEICKHCMKLFCKRCETKSLCTTQTPNKTYRSVHHTVQLREVTDELREKMRSLSQELYDKMKRCRNLEKTTWRKLSDLEEHVQQQANTVDNIAEEMITKIKRLRDDIKSELQSYADKASTEVEKYSEEMLISITVLDDNYRYGQTLADRTPDKILLEEFTLAESELTQAAADIDIEKVLLMKKPYIDKGTPLVDVCTKVISEPGNLDFISTHETSGKCYGVSWTEDGSRVLCAMLGGLEVRGDGGTVIRKVDIADPEAPYSAYLMADRLYTHMSSNTLNKYLTYAGSLDKPKETLLYEVEYDWDKNMIHHISVSQNRLAILDYVSRELRIYTPGGTHMFNIELKGMTMPNGVELLPADNSVLVTDLAGEQLRKYRLEPDAEPVWTCPGLNQPTGVTADESGLIYVTGSDNGTVYVISPQGEKIKELTHPKLKEAAENENWILDISVSAGRIVVACKAGGVMYFNMV